MLESRDFSIFLYDTFITKERETKEYRLLGLQKLVSQCTASILYTPLKTEIDYNKSSFPLKIHLNKLFIPNVKESDPLEWAANCITKFKNTKVCIFIPGERFDIHGTRHGKGGGWYDRFLSAIPSEWLRIGITDKSKMSHSKILKQKWDEPVDWIVVNDSSDDSWKIYRRCNAA